MASSVSTPTPSGGARKQPTPPTQPLQQPGVSGADQGVATTPTTTTTPGGGSGGNGAKAPRVKLADREKLDPKRVEKVESELSELFSTRGTTGSKSRSSSSSSNSAKGKSKRRYSSTGSSRRKSSRRDSSGGSGSSASAGGHSGWRRTGHTRSANNVLATTGGSGIGFEPAVSSGGGDDAGTVSPQTGGNSNSTNVTIAATSSPDRHSQPSASDLHHLVALTKGYELLTLVSGLNKLRGRAKLQVVHTVLSGLELLQSVVAGAAGDPANSSSHNHSNTRSGGSSSHTRRRGRGRGHGGARDEAVRSLLTHPVSVFPAAVTLRSQESAESVSSSATDASEHSRSAGGGGTGGPGHAEAPTKKHKRGEALSRVFSRIKSRLSGGGHNKAAVPPARTPSSSPPAPQQSGLRTPPRRKRHGRRKSLPSSVHSVLAPPLIATGGDAASGGDGVDAFSRVTLRAPPSPRIEALSLAHPATSGHTSRRPSSWLYSSHGSGGSGSRIAAGRALMGGVDIDARGDNRVERAASDGTARDRRRGRSGKQHQQHGQHRGSAHSPMTGSAPSPQLSEERLAAATELAYCLAAALSQISITMRDEVRSEATSVLLTLESLLATCKSVVVARFVACCFASHHALWSLLVCARTQTQHSGSSFLRCRYCSRCVP